MDAVDPSRDMNCPVTCRPRGRRMLPLASLTLRGDAASRGMKETLAGDRSPHRNRFRDPRRKWTIRSSIPRDSSADSFWDAIVHPLRRMLKQNGKVTKRKVYQSDFAFLIVFSLLVPQGLAGESPVKYNRSSAKVCSTVNIRNNTTDFEVLKDCEVIEGNLQIVLVANWKKYCNEACVERINNMTFPKLREVTGYVVFWRFYFIRSLGTLFPNLSLIRGRTLFLNYALVVFEMEELQEIGLYSLTQILRGSVHFDRNYNLCFVKTINWDMIAKSGRKRHYFGESRPDDKCQKCPEVSTNNEVCPRSSSGKPLCWNPDHCQKAEDVDSPHIVPDQLPLLHNTEQCLRAPTGECCHKSCLGGCDGPSSKDCHACAEVVLNVECLDKCPQNTYKYLDRRCVTSSECYNISKPLDWELSDLEKPYPFRPVQDSCLMECPANFIEEETKLPKFKGKRYQCTPCKGTCKKECQGARIENIADIQKLYGCTHITGSLEIQLRSGGNIVEELDKSLGSIEEISGYLKVARSRPLVSLDFLKNLKLIKGDQLDNNKSAFVLLDNENLEELWDWTTRDKEMKIKGRLAFHYNPKLCFDKIEKFSEIAKLPPFTNEEVPRETNGDKVACNISSLHPYVVYQSNGVVIKWKPFQHYDPRTIFGYVIYYTEAPNGNVSLYHNRNACGGDGWNSDDIDTNQKGNEDEMSYAMTQLQPYTQYAYYIRTYGLWSEKRGAQSAIQYFTTNPGTPTHPEKLWGYSNSTSEIVLSWSPPLEPRGELVRYEVVAYPLWELTADDPFICNEIAKKKLEPPPPPILTTLPPKPASGECSCPQPEKPGTKDRDTEDMRDFNIKFENTLQRVYLIRKQSSYDRRKREMTYTDSNHQQQLVHETGSLFSKNNGEKLESMAETEPLRLNISVSTTQIVIKGLTHYTNYKVDVRACRAIVKSEVGPVVPCSEKSTTYIRTMKSKDADNIPDISLTQERVNGSLEEMRLRWEEPVKPNGMILAYKIEYRRVDNDKYMPQSECVTREKFLKQKKEYVLKNLAPGNYTVHVLAATVAGDGPYSRYMSFYIPQPSQSTMADIWSGVLGAFIACSIFFGIYLFWKRKTNGVPKLFTNVNPEYVSAATVYVPDEWEVPRKNIELIRELGQGSFGMVYEGIARDIVQGQPEVRCAVKTVNEVATDRDRMEFLNEASVMKAFNTHHVVQLLGVVSEGQPTLVVMELMVNGDLKTYLRSHRPEFCEDKKRQPPTLKRILGMAIEIADGMAYLAAKKFVHRDLAARNCMVAEDLTVKIGDFGMTRDIYETDYYKKGTKGLLPVRWMAPESLKDGVFTTHSDVWSYGVVLWEMVTLASQPYQGLSNDQVLRYVIEGGIMERPENCPDKLYELMKLCWQHKPSGRPHFMDFVTALLSDASPEFCKKSYYHSSEGRELRAHLDAAEADMIIPTSDTPLRLLTDIEDFSVGGSEPELDEDEEEAELDVEPGFVSPQRGMLSSKRSDNWPKGTTKTAALASVSSSDSSRASKLSNGGANTPVNGYVVGRSSNGTRTTQC